MEVRLHARNTSIDDAFRALVEEKLGRASRVFDDGAPVDVELTETQNPRRDRFHLELTSAVGGRTLRIASDADTAEAALDDAVDRFGRQLRRSKERVISSHRQSAVRPDTADTFEPTDEVVRVKQFVMKPMSVEEAALQMEMLGHGFFFFLNAANDRQSVLYRRKDGRLGLIEPA